MQDEPELNRLYDEHAKALFAFLLNFTRDDPDTRDLLQEVFVKLAREPELLSRVRDERAFWIRLAHNAAIDLMRRSGTRQKHQEQAGPGPARPAGAGLGPWVALSRTSFASGLAVTASATSFESAKPGRR